jgi:hypothetical protein
VQLCHCIAPATATPACFVCHSPLRCTQTSPCHRREAPPLDRPLDLHSAVHIPAGWPQSASRLPTPFVLLYTEAPKSLSTTTTPLRNDTTRRPRHSTLRARGSERIPRLLAGNLGVARSYTLIHTRTTALVCACAHSHGAAPAEHVCCTLELERCRTRAIGDWWEHVCWTRCALALRFA